MLKQLTVFLENTPGRLAEATGVLADAAINLHALSIADTADFGILRMIVSDPARAAAALKEKGLMVKTNNVIAVATGHTPGSLHKILKDLELLGIAVEYLYAFASPIREYKALVVLRLSDQAVAMEKLRDSGFMVLGEDLLTQLNES